jgi:hypothetical protein
VVQGPAELPHQIANPLLPQAAPVCDHAAALDPPVDLLDPQPTLGPRLGRHGLLPRERLAAGLLGRHEALPLRERAGQEAQSLSQPAPGGQGRRGRVGPALIMDAASTRLPAKKAHEQGVDQQDMVYGVVLCLAALTGALWRRVWGADEPPCGAVMGTRGATDAAAAAGTTGAGTASSGTPPLAALASETPSRWARAGRERAEAAPRGRSAARSTGKSPWLPGGALPWTIPHKRPCTT